MSLPLADNGDTAPHPTDASLPIISNDKQEYGTAESSEDDDLSYPEGGLQAWLVVLGSFSAM